MEQRIDRVFVAGAGLMGHGIAQVHAQIGRQVDLYEPDLARAEAGRDRIVANLERAVSKGRLTAGDRDATIARIKPTADIVQSATAGLVIEAVYEDLEVKSWLLSDLDERAPAATLFATNTSSIAIADLAAAMRPPRRRRFIGMHFFSPVPVMPLVELIRGPDTDDATVEAIRALAVE
nr:3-hydroxybutyryl-CoA dehydrogenase [Chloroflexota bacterium]